MATSTADVLEAAADRIDRDGWWNGDPMIAGFGYCALTAILASAVNDEQRNHDWTALEEFRVFLDVPSVPDWNDSRLDAFEVTNSLRKAAAHLRAEQ